LKEYTYLFHVSRIVYSFCYRTHCVLCEVQTKALPIGLMSIHCFLPYRAMAQVVSHRLSPWRPGFDPGPVRVRFMIDKVALGQVFSKHFGFLLSSFLQYSILTTWMLILAVGQSDEAWEPSNQQCCHGYRGTLDIKLVSDYFFRSSNYWVSFY